ncbi:MAG: hypothetical protein JWO12_3337 [Frankiales bacterium]|nr:hypothetical protein [Frankiales bacterium]
MLFALVVLLVAVGVGYTAGGRLDGLSTLNLRRSWVVAAAVVVQLVGGLVGGAAYPLGLAASALLVGYWLTANRGVRGTGLVALGLLSNALVVGINGAMPVRGEALGRARLSTQDILSGEDPRHELAGPATHLLALGDVIPVLLPVHPEVVSVGDVLVAAGLAQLVVVGMRRRLPVSLPAHKRAVPGATDA